VTTAAGSLGQAEASLTKAQASLQSAADQQNAALQTAENTVAQNQAAVETQRANLALTSAPASAEDLAAGRAQVENARAGLTLARNNLDATVLRAPTSGTIAAINGAVGQWVSGGPTGSIITSTSSTNTPPAPPTRRLRPASPRMRS
jgi:multidrug resistance efflux pump